MHSLLTPVKLYKPFVRTFISLRMPYPYTNILKKGVHCVIQRPKLLLRHLVKECIKLSSSNGVPKVTAKILPNFLLLIKCSKALEECSATYISAPEPDQSTRFLLSHSTHAAYSRKSQSTCFSLQKLWPVGKSVLHCTLKIILKSALKTSQHCSVILNFPPLYIYASNSDGAYSI